LTPRLIINKDASDTRSVNKVPPYFSRLDRFADRDRYREITSRLCHEGRHHYFSGSSRNPAVYFSSRPRTRGSFRSWLRGCENVSTGDPRVPTRDLSHYFLLETRDVKGDKAGGSRIRRRKSHGGGGEGGGGGKGEG